MNEFDSLYDLAESVQYQVNAFVTDKMTSVVASDLGLDSRCGRLFVSSNEVAVFKSNDRTLQYYAGFEYVDSECRYELGNYVFYTADSDRVADCLEHYRSVVDFVDTFMANTEEA